VATLHATPPREAHPGEPVRVAVGFDGTWINGGSNVYALLRAYDGDVSAYVRGIGTAEELRQWACADYLTGVAFGRGWEHRVDAAVRFVVKQAQNHEGTPVEVDVFGFSRGSIEARVFSQRLIKLPGYLPVRTHFLGVFETVGTTMDADPEELRPNAAAPAVQLVAEGETWGVYMPTLLAPTPGMTAQEANPLHLDVQVPGTHPQVGGDPSVGPSIAGDMARQVMWKYAMEAGVPLRPIPFEWPAGQWPVGRRTGGVERVVAFGDGSEGLLRSVPTAASVGLALPYVPTPGLTRQGIVGTIDADGVRQQLQPRPTTSAKKPAEPR